MVVITIAVLVLLPSAFPETSFSSLGIVDIKLRLNIMNYYREKDREGLKSMMHQFKQFSLYVIDFLSASHRLSSCWRRMRKDMLLLLAAILMLQLGFII